MNHVNLLRLLLLAGCLSSPVTHAESIHCATDTSTASLKKICSQRFTTLRENLDNQLLSTYLVSDAPMRLLTDTQQLWLKQLQQCKSNDCIQQQFDQRQNDLNFYTLLNQNLTQHYLKFEHGRLATHPVHLQVHQLSKDRIKIEGLAYRNPNNRKENQTIAFLAYTTPNTKHDITDNEHACKYQFEFQKALLNVKTQQKGCERFAGIYRLYD